MRPSMYTWSVALGLAAIGCVSFAGSASAQQRRIAPTRDRSTYNDTDVVTTQERGPRLFVPKSTQPKDNWPSIIGESINRGINDGMRYQREWPKNNNDGPRWNQRPERWSQDDDDYDNNDYQPSPPPISPPKNTIVAKAKPQLKKSPLNTLGNPVALSLTETDARQQVEATQATGMLDADIATQVTKINDPQLYEDWKKVVQGGHKTADVEKFILQHGPGGDNKLTTKMLTTLDMRQKFAKYSDALASGSLTPDGKQAALAELQSAVTASASRPGADPTFYGTLTDKVTNMSNFNTMGQLADVTQGSDNPFPTLLQGADQMGMPVMFVSEMTGFPVMSVNPVANSGTTPASILLFNPEANGQTVKYLLDEYPFEMAAGMQQQLERGYLISFDPGGGDTQKQYQMSDGVYEWRSDATDGWSLVKVKVTVQIDNSRYDGEFRYLLNNESKLVAAGEVAEHTSELPIEVAFNGGKGGSDSRKVLRSGRYIVGLDPSRGQLDLFESSKVDAADAKQPKYVSSTSIGGSKATQAQRVESLLAQLKPAGGGAPVGGIAGPQKTVSPLGSPRTSAKSVEDLLKSIKK